jgi:hypothetical protein
MPGALHEGLVLLLSAQPRVLVDLVGDALGLPPGATVSVVAGDPNEHEPVATERRADLTLIAGAGTARRVVVVEVQVDRDETKLEVWPYYAMAARLRHHCPACLVVVALDPAVAAWAGQTIAPGQPGCGFRPVVLGRAEVPARAPVEAPAELHVLAALAHGDQPGGEAALGAAAGAVDGLGRVDADLAARYYWIVYEALGPVMQRKWSEMMTTDWLEDSALGRELKAKWTAEAAARARAEGEARGRAEGEARGRAEGEALGRIEGLVVAVLSVLSARGLTVSEAERARILACTDAATLERWARQAATAGSVGAALA